MWALLPRGHDHEFIANGVSVASWFQSRFGLGNSNTGSASGILVKGGIGFHFHHHPPLVRIAGTLNSQRYFSEVVELVVLPYIQRLPSVIFQQDNAHPHVARNVQGFFFTHQIELLPWPACSPDLSPIEHVWSKLTQRLARDTPPASTPDQL
ncbi:transposable element Tcb2 transposase [Trichonephila clavipes]|nr:transposable element Tcb2 transposase [Trichonephila clavipes]